MQSIFNLKLKSKLCGNLKQFSSDATHFFIELEYTGYSM